MRRSITVSALAAAAALAAGLGSPAAAVTPAAAAPKPLADHVVLFALDGFDVSYLETYDEVPTPNLDRLIARGSLSTSTGVMTSITNPSWSSVATGAWPSTHLNTAYWYDETTGTARSQQRDLAVPTIAQAIRDQGGSVLSAQWFIVQKNGTTFGDPEGLYTQPGGDCSARVDDAVNAITGAPVMSGGAEVTMDGVPELTVAYCDTLDALGHAGGDIHPEIPAAIAELDAQLGRLVQATKDAGVYGRTAFIVTGDHGMSTFTEGLQPEITARLAEAGYDIEFLTAGQSPSPEAELAIVVGGSGSVHFLGDVAADPEAVAEVEAVFESIPQIAHVHDKAEQAAMHVSPKYGELVVEPEEGWTLASAPAGPRGAHGMSANLEVPLIVSGSGVLPGREADGARHIDVAPTIAALLGMEGPAGADGRVLTELLRK